MLKMTKNEYKAYLRSNADKIYNDNIQYTMTDYCRDADNVEILPLDLSAYPEITAKTAKYINMLFDEEDTDKNGNYMLRGFCGDSVARWTKEKQVLSLNYAPYGFYYAGFGFNDKEMLIYTWCEGDTTLTLFNDRALYEQERAATEKWYDEHDT